MPDPNSGRDEADKLEALLVEHVGVELGQRVAPVERLEHMVVVAEDVGELEHRHFRHQRRQRRRRDRTEVDRTELDLLRDFALAAERARIVVRDLELAAGQLAEFFVEGVGGERRPVLGRVDVAHRHFLAGSRGAGDNECQDGGQEKRRNTAEASHRHY